MLLFSMARAFGDQNPMLGVAFGAALVSWVGGLFVGYRGRGRSAEEHGTIRIDDQGIHWNGELLAVKGKITSAVVSPQKDGVAVEVTTVFGRRFSLRVRDVAEGEQILRTLGFAVEQRTIQARMISALGYSGLSHLFNVVAGLGVMATSLVTFLSVLPSAFALPPILLSIVAFFALCLWPTKLSIGADGVLVKWMWRERFMRYSEVARIERDGGGGVVLVGHDGKRFMVIPASNRYGLDSEAVIERIREAMSLGSAGGRDIASAALARRGRKVSEWVAALRNLERVVEGGPRTAPLLADDLWRVLEDVRAGESARAGAALALSTSLKGKDRERLRIASEAMASPSLRIAVEAAVDGNDERLAAALAAIEDEGEEARARAG
jgi:hypothetical protein